MLQYVAHMTPTHNIYDDSQGNCQQVDSLRFAIRLQPWTIVSLSCGYVLLLYSVNFMEAGSIATVT